MRYVIRERFFRLGNDFDITDRSGNPVLRVDGKVFTLHDRLVLRDPSGREVAEVRRKLVALRPTYTISVGGEKAAEVRKHFFTPFHDKFTIDIPGPNDLEMSGNLLDHEFTVEQGGREVAVASKRWLTVRDTYGVEIADDADQLVILAAVLALDLAHEREERKERDEDRDDD